MHSEYAVEPDAVAANWERCRYISEKFGFDKGRVLSLFPKNWLKLAIEVINTVGSEGDIKPLEKKRIIEMLRKLKRDCAIASGRDYDPDSKRGWLSNAIGQQSSKPFHAIIATENPDKLDYVLIAQELDEMHERMKAEQNCSIARDVESLLNAFSLLLRSSTQIAFVDPYFSLFDDGYRLFLSRCLNMLEQSNSNCIREISIHYRFRGKMPSISGIENDAIRISEILPKDFALDIHCWKTKENGEDFHDRFLLTNRGGMSIGTGFKPNGPNSTTNVSLMSHTGAKLKLESFMPNSLSYELIDRPLRIFSSGESTRI